MNTVHHLNCGTMCPRGGRLLGGEGGPLSTAKLACNCLLLEGDDGLTLVDTGFGLDDVRRPRQLGVPFRAVVRPTLDSSETAISQLRERGLDPADVRNIVVTHLDLDHAGGLPDFPQADVHVHADELDAALNGGLRERQRYVAAHWSHGPRWVRHSTGGDNWFGFQSIRALSDDVLLIPLHGHTRGHAGVAVRDGERWLLHCGDAYFHHGQVQTPPHCPPGLAAFQAIMALDSAARRENVERLRELAQRHSDEVTLICAHDPERL